MISTRTALPGAPRLARAREYAGSLARSLGLDALPVDIFGIYRALWAHVLLLGTGEAKTLLHTEDPFHLYALCADARTLYLRERGLYLVVYEDAAHLSPGRIRFTLAHELGHILLGHLTDFEQTALCRGGMSRRALELLEKEADAFAAELLCPRTLLAPLCGPEGPLDGASLQLLCGISREAAAVRLKELLAPRAEEAEDLFPPALYHRVHTALGEALLAAQSSAGSSGPVRVCPHCRACMYEAEGYYCPVCGRAMGREQLSPLFDLPPLYTVPPPPAPPQERPTRSSDPDQPFPSRCLRQGRRLPPGYIYCPHCGCAADHAAAKKEHRERLLRMRADFRTGACFHPWEGQEQLLCHMWAQGPAALLSALQQSLMYENEAGDLLCLCASDEAADTLLHESRGLFRVLDPLTHKKCRLGIYVARDPAVRGTLRRGERSALTLSREEFAAL